MTPDERQLLSGLFDRIRNAGSQPRDGQAESFIADAVRSQPYAPYLLAQTVIVQDQALRAANDKLQELESKVQSLQGDQQGTGGTSFLGNIGRTIFGQGSNEPQQRSPVPSAGYAQGGPGQGGYAQPQGGYAQPQGGFAQQGPWGQGAGQFAQGAQGGGFLKGALGAAAGVAGGVLLANSISGLFHGNNSLGIASGMPGFGGGGYPGGETIVNNYYGDEGGGGNAGDGGYDNAGDFGSSDGGMSPDDAGFSSDDGGFGSEDSYNV